MVEFPVDFEVVLPGLNGQQIVEAARKYLGMPYLHAGRAASGGLDCYGLVVQALFDLGAHFFDAGSYPVADNWMDLEKGMAQFCRPLEAGTADSSFFKPALPFGASLEGTPARGLRAGEIVPAQALPSVDALSHLSEIGKANCIAGDILTFRSSRIPHHMGIYTGYGLIHVFNGANMNRVTEGPIAPVWLRGEVRAYRYLNLIEEKV